MGKFWQALQKADLILIVVMCLLFAFGSVALYSVGLGLSADHYSLVLRQFLFFCGGLVLFGFFMTVDYRQWQPFYPWFYVAGFVLLLLLFSPLGEVIRGVRSWLNMGFFVWEPVEFVKVLLVVSLAAYFTKQGRHLRTWKPMFVSGSAVALLVFLTMAQPDLGSAMMLFFVWLGLVLILGLSRWQIALMIIGFVGMTIFAWFFLLKPYQQNRLVTFIDPSRDPLETGYNLTQSIIAIGSGQILGRGIGFGSQSQLRFLPESQDDFIFAVIGEELGLAGIILLMTLYGLLGWRLIVIARRTRHDFGQVLCIGIFFSILGQTALHIAINMGLSPVTGIPLPFISAGGSYILAAMSMLGLAESVAVHE